LKDGFAEPSMYLGAQVKKWNFPDSSGKSYWALSSHQYVTEAIKNVELYLQPYNHALPKHSNLYHLIIIQSLT
jgi:hypothetical protein